MKKLFTEIYNRISHGENVVLVTIVAHSGSTPRGAGARMMVGEDGKIAGTIGGGAVEYKAQQLAAEVLKKKQSYIKGFKLSPNQVADLGMICGGDVIVYFQFIEGNNPSNISLIKEIIELCSRDEDSWIITDITDEEAWSMGTYCLSKGISGLDDLPEENIVPMLGNRSIITTQQGKKYYTEPLMRAGRVCIFGGGHISQELVPVLSHIGFRCLVMDDRSEFAGKALFPQAESVITGDFDHISEYVEIHPSDYVVIMTRGHQFDYNVLSHALKTPACYIGVIGSAQKMKITSERLFNEGFTQKDLDRIYTPIGTPIKAESPAEIAISIAGELICVRATHSGK